MRVLFAGIYSSPKSRKTGGPIAVFSNLVDSIARAKLDHKVDIVSQSFLLRGKIKLTDSVIIYLVPILRINELLLFISKLLRKKYDIINIQGVSELNVIVAIFGKLSGAKIVYSCHGLVIDEIRFTHKYMFRLLIEELLQLKLSDVLITVSEKFKDRINEIYHFPKEKIYVIYNGISDYWVQSCFAESNSQKSEPYLLFVGATDRRKGFDLLLVAFKKLKEKYKHLRLLVVGKKPNHHIMKYAGEAIDDIIFVSDIDKEALRKIYKEATVFVLPSRQDSFPLVVLEALSQGVPVVISDQVGVSEIIKDGQHGLIFESNNVNELTKCLERILSDENLRKRLATEGRKLATSRTWRHVLGDYIEYFEMLIVNKTKKLK